jgi:hypothetical protein
MLLKKIFYTVVLLSAIRIGNFIPIVDINQAYLYESLKGSSILSLLNTFSQGKQFILGIFFIRCLTKYKCVFINAVVYIDFSRFEKVTERRR